MSASLNCNQSSECKLDICGSSHVMSRACLTGSFSIHAVRFVLATAVCLDQCRKRCVRLLCQRCDAARMHFCIHGTIRHRVAATVRLYKPQSHSRPANMPSIRPQPPRVFFTPLALSGAMMRSIDGIVHSRSTFHRRAMNRCVSCSSPCSLQLASALRLRERTGATWK
jgi:hypothetical protein